MTSGRYTAYHIYQNLSFPEAEQAATWPYKAPEYQCKHSQRGALFQFDNMVERTHFDAAVTSCCDEPVINFGNKPQYSDATKPMKSVDCGAKLKEAVVDKPVCRRLDVTTTGEEHELCGGSTPGNSSIRIECPLLCPDLGPLLAGGVVEGQYGEFSFESMDTEYVMNVNYELDESISSGWYDNCSGESVLTETFCAGYSISYTFRAGLDYPSGCGCDCCGANGSFPPPVMELDVPSSLSGGWTNTISMDGEIVGDEACSGGSLEGTFSGSGSEAAPWDGATQYESDGSTRYVTREYDGEIGGSGNSTCCGGVIHWSGSDGCGSGATAQTPVQAKIGSSSIVPASGTELYENASYTFSGSGACSFTSTADMDLTKECLTNSTLSLYRYNGYMTRRFYGSLRFSGTHDCSGCCGAGEVHLNFSNGCGGELEADYHVRRPLAGTNHLVGYMYKCQRSYQTGYGWVYKPMRADLRCQGTSGAFSSGFTGMYYVDLGECVSSVSGTGASEISGVGGCLSASLSGGSDCCWYSDNGQSGSGFVSRIYSVSGSVCCDIEAEPGDSQWAYSGSGARCCPIQ